MLKKILIPLDGSQLAALAIDHGLKIVAADGEVILISVLQTPDAPIYDFYPMAMTSLVDYDKAYEEAAKRARDYLAHTAEMIGKRAGIRVKTDVEAGDPATVIVARATTLQSEAIVMSTHGRSGLGRFLFGSVTQRVLEIAPCPVYVVPARTREDAKLGTQEMEGVPTS